jgi:pyruvate kinase
MYKRMAKVVCTIGPASFSPSVLRALIQNGMNVARLNFSHGSHDSHREVIHSIRTIAAEEGTYVGILQDLAGPKIRLGNLPEEGVSLETGSEISLSSAIKDYMPGILPVAYPNLHEDVHPGETILLADGLMELQISRIEDDIVVCLVLNGGQVFSRKGVNLPGSKLRIKAFSEKDRADLCMGLEEKVDFVAVSFVRNAEDLAEVRELIDNSPHKPRLIAKIEKPQAVDNLQSILESVDAVMVARGDLGVEMPLERVPVIQKEIIKSARLAGKSVITATQMLMSMVSSPRPTRSEASDVANAIIDGTDAVMLSDESANGAYPVQSCNMLGRIVAATEPYVREDLPSVHFSSLTGRTSVSYAVGHAAASLADDIRAAAIIAYTGSGFTAYAVSRFRPACPILALTTSEAACRQLALSWGTKAVLTQAFSDTDDMFEEARRVAIAHGVEAGRHIVLTAGIPGIKGSTSLLRVLEI